jgi:AAA+ ATPase superfamily predicted ATPase
LPYAATRAFLPGYTAEQRVAIYAVVGGVPAYLERFTDTVSVTENLRNNLFRETGLFRIDPDYLIGEHVRDLKSYQAVLAAIAEGASKPTDISLMAGFSNRASADVYLQQLIEMDYVRRELPVTLPPQKRSSARVARYLLADSYLRFYFRFVRPNLDIISQELYAEVEQRISSQLRAFIGMTAFEEICRAWLLLQAQLGKLPFPAEQVGSHWDKHVQVDAVAISWRTQSILLGEAKWQADMVELDVVRELLEQKQPKVLASLPDGGAGWNVYSVCFARMGFTPAAQRFAAEQGVDLVDLQRLDADLCAVL